ncbi:hypothetical protein AJ79_02057 [Helicocarpus griseus UAMH5409]|uniref:Uncharacterized protein n=1 Tax=Helicocarpus griseus UAMH5409 TaxID=1447875 RepID=A0A2B7Y3S1_9EURO|nr:hypothetical protein AJ79_02057 [Helicocarpus griseus UAMH5409]
MAASVANSPSSTVSFPHLEPDPPDKPQPKKKRSVHVTVLGGAPPGALLAENRRLQEQLQAKEKALQSTKGTLDLVSHAAKASIENEHGIHLHLLQRIAQLEDIVGQQKNPDMAQSQANPAPPEYKAKPKPHALSFTFATPQHHMGGQEAPRVSRYQHVFDNPPPKFGLKNQDTPRSAGNETASSTSPITANSMSSIDRLNAFVPPIGPDAAADQMIIPMSAMPVAVPPGMMIMEGAEYNVMDFGDCYNNLFQKVEAFTKMYVNAPNGKYDSMINPASMAHLVKSSHANLVSGFLSDPTTRYVLLIKAMNLYIVENVLKLSVIRGFDSTADSEISQLIGILYPNAPAVVRALIRQGVSRQVNRIRNDPLFSQFFNKRKSENASALFSLIEPLVERNQPGVWTDFSDVIEEAYNLALMMYSGPYEFDHDFPKVGEFFDLQLMFNRDMNLVGAGGDAHTMMKNGYRVKLGVTPTIYFRSNASAVDEPVLLMTMASVLVTPGPIIGGTRF